MRAPAELRVVTWNVWWRFGERWEERQEGIAATLERLDADIIGLQESWATREESQAAVLAERLGMQSQWAGPSLPELPDEPESPDHAGVDLGLAVLSRWPILDSWTRTLPSSRDVAPVALVAVIEHPRGPLRVVCTCAEHHAHFGDDHVAQTRELAELVLELAALESPLPVLLIGDLNAPPDGPELAPLLEVMTDAWTAAGHAPDEGVTLSSEHPDAPLGAAKQLDRRIDYVLVRPSAGGRAPEVRSASVDTDRVDGLHPSDHFAVVADLKV
ncbi:endonuclease/exonuclease/phosphatase family protein [Agrococcus lahaulensis]|uniref:endonuclease/exonuclease/phosphatase family protein n=1 Tax=Agrococcus lahaulensis TaxID=341722 RepID=UPI00041B7C9A|nr:endonuclease/exonuclease/phosphatase family protein [Agrococcus lahaulensis]